MAKKIKCFTCNNFIGPTVCGIQNSPETKRIVGTGASKNCSQFQERVSVPLLSNKSDSFQKKAKYEANDEYISILYGV